MIVTLGGLEFVSSGADALDATYVIGPDGLKGWLDGVDTRREMTGRSNAHGDFDAPGFLSGRLITLTGHVVAATPAAYDVAIAALSGLLADGSMAELEVVEASGTLTANVRRHGALEVNLPVYGRAAQFQLQLWAPDPRRYGAAQTPATGASVSVSHDGNFPATPVVTVTGAVSAPYTVASQGHSVTVTQALSGGQVHTIDMATGWVYLDGVLQSGVTSAIDVFTIPPGDPVTVTGPSSMTVDVVDTYA